MSLFVCEIISGVLQLQAWLMLQTCLMECPTASQRVVALESWLHPSHPSFKSTSFKRQKMMVSACCCCRSKAAALASLRPGKPSQVIGYALPEALQSMASCPFANFLWSPPRLGLSRYLLLRPLQSRKYKGSQGPPLQPPVACFVETATGKAALLTPAQGCTHFMQAFWLRDGQRSLLVECPHPPMHHNSACRISVQLSRIDAATGSVEDSVWQRIVDRLGDYMHRPNSDHVLLFLQNTELGLLDMATLTITASVKLPPGERAHDRSRFGEVAWSSNGDWLAADFWVGGVDQELWLLTGGLTVCHKILDSHFCTLSRLYWAPDLASLSMVLHPSPAAQQQYSFRIIHTASF